MVLRVYKQYTDSLDLKEVANVTSYLAVNIEFVFFGSLQGRIQNFSRGGAK